MLSAITDVADWLRHYDAAPSAPTIFRPERAKVHVTESTDYDETLTREEAADALQHLASELRGTGVTEVPVGNKLLTLSPSPTLDYAIEVEERSPMMSGDRETVTVTLDWEVEDEPDPDR